VTFLVISNSRFIRRLPDARCLFGNGNYGTAHGRQPGQSRPRVSTWNRTPGNGKDVEGARAASTPRHRARGRGSRLDVRLRHQGRLKPFSSVQVALREALAEGMIVADSSTISPSATLRFAERVKRRGGSLRRRPITGSKIARRKRPVDFHGRRRRIHSRNALAALSSDGQTSLPQWAKPVQARPPNSR